MKFRVFLACLTCVLTVARAETREFTNSDGKTIKGEITSVSTTQAVIIREADRKIFTIPLASLSAADQEFLARWREENPEFILSFEAERQTGNRDNSRKDSSFSSSKKNSSEVSYRITVTNKGKIATPAARLLFYSHLEVNGNPSGLYSQKSKDDVQKMPARLNETMENHLNCQGTLDLPVIDPGKSVDLETPTVKLVDTSSFHVESAGEGYTETYASKSKETIKGISLIVQYREREVATWTTSGTAKQLVRFQDYLRKEEEERIWKAKQEKH